MALLLTPLEVLATGRKLETSVTRNSVAGREMSFLSRHREIANHRTRVYPRLIPTRYRVVVLTS
jgi:hypothetical protein